MYLPPSLYKYLSIYIHTRIGTYVMSSHVMQCNGMVWYGMVCVYMWVNVCVQIHIEHAVMLDQLRFYHSRAAQQLIQDIMDGRDPRVQIWIYVQGDSIS